MTEPLNPSTDRQAAEAALRLRIIEDLTMGYQARHNAGGQSWNEAWASASALVDGLVAAVLRPEPLDGLRAALELADRGLEVLHSPHFDWGCNAVNCSGQAAIEALAALRAEGETE
jgi:hypothetical protein